MELSIKIKDDILQSFGILYVQTYLQKQVQLLELQFLAEKMSATLKESIDTDWETEFDQAKQEAWDEYKVKFTTWQTEKI